MCSLFLLWQKKNSYSVGNQSMKPNERLIMTWHLYPYIIFCFISENFSASDHIVTVLSLAFKVSTEEFFFGKETVWQVSITKNLKLLFKQESFHLCLKVWVISVSFRQQLVCCDSAGWLCKGLRNSQENELWVLPILSPVSVWSYT